MNRPHARNSLGKVFVDEVSMALACKHAWNHNQLITVMRIAVGNMKPRSDLLLKVGVGCVWVKAEYPEGKDGHASITVTPGWEQTNSGVGSAN